MVYRRNKNNIMIYTAGTQTHYCVVNIKTNVFYAEYKTSQTQFLLIRNEF